MTLGMPIPGNAVEVFQNGAFFDALLADIAAARQTVHFETFLWKEGALGQRMAEAFAARARAGLQVRLVLDAQGCRKMGEAAQRLMKDAGCRLAMYHPRTLRNIGVLRRARPPQARDPRRPRRLGRRSLHRRRMARRRPGPPARARSLGAPHRPGGARGAVGVQRELGRGDRQAVRRRRRVPAAAEGRRRGRAHRERQARGLGAGGQDPAPRRDLLRAQAHPHPESLLHPRARRDRRPGARGAARRGRAHHGAVGGGIRHGDRAACGAPQLPGAARRRRAHPRIRPHAAAPESDDDRRRLVRGGLEQLRRPLVRDQRRDHRGLPRRRAGAAPGGDLRGRRAPLPRAGRRGRGGAAACWHRLQDNALYLFNEVL